MHLQKLFSALACVCVITSPMLKADEVDVVKVNREELVQHANRAVLRIITLKGKHISTGTGFVVDSSGLIITNEHVIKDASSIGILIVAEDRQSARAYEAECLRVDKAHDLALLKVSAEDLPAPLTISEAGPNVLNDVIAVGFPGAIDSAISKAAKFENGYTDSPDMLENLTPNITKGAVSKVTEQSITHDAKISRGNSGGPLIDLATGKVVGVNAMGINDRMSTFYMAIPAERICALLARSDVDSTTTSDSRTQETEVAIMPHHDGFKSVDAERIIEQADGGDIESMLIAASIFRQGYKVPKDKQRAVEYYRKAADKGSDKAMFHLAIMQRDGIVDGTPNIEEYVQWMTKAADAGNIDACYSLGLYYFSIRPAKNADTLTFKYLQKAVEGGNADALIDLSNCYQWGIGTKVSNDKAEAYLLKALELGVDGSKFNLGCFYAAQKDREKYKKGVALLRSGADEDDDVSCQTILGTVYLYGDGHIEPDVDKAMQYLTKAAKGGDSQAQVQLGEMYLTGTAVSKDLKIAEMLLLSALEQQNADACDKLARLYLEQGDQLNYIKFAQRGVKMGNPRCALILGGIYVTGKGLPKNRELAVKHFTMAAEQQDDREAQFLGREALRRLGVGKSAGGSQKRRTGGKKTTSAKNSSAKTPPPPKAASKKW